MAGSPDAGLDAGAAGEWRARAFPGALEVARRLPPGPGQPHGPYAERALALRMRVLVQKVPPYRALHGLQAVAPDGWADAEALRYPSHAELVPPFLGKATDMRPTAHGWVDTAPGRRAPNEPGPSVGVPGPGSDSVEETLSGLFDRVRRYIGLHSAVRAIGSAEQERGLARVCLMLARFEAGVVPERGATADEIHQSVPGEEVREVAGLIEGLRRTLPLQSDPAVSLAGLLSAGRGPVRGVAEPVFVRGWAEGDLMIGGTLVAVCLGGQDEVARRLRHLVAHAWLDDGDRYRVRRVGLYTGVPNTLFSWPVADLAAQLLLPGADQGAARAEFRALAGRETAVPRPVPAADAAARRGRPAASAPSAGKPGRATPATGVYGPEAWDVVDGAEWTYWDLWFSVACVADCRGDWDELDAMFYAGRASKQYSEAMWCHLTDLRERLAAAGLNAASLAGDLATHRKTVEKARSKVLNWTGIRDEDFSPAMRDVPSGRRYSRAHFGSWDLYPVSPRPFYEQLAAAAPFDLEAPGWDHPTSGNIEALFGALEVLEAGNRKDPPALLAARRAGLTASALAFRCCNDSYGDLAQSTSDVMLRFSRTDWRATGIEPAAFWRDVLEVFTVIAEFGVSPHEHARELMAGPGAERDKGLVEQVAGDLHASYLSGRLDWAASRLKELWEFI